MTEIMAFRRQLRERYQAEGERAPYLEGPAFHAAGACEALSTVMTALETGEIYDACDCGEPLEPNGGVR